VASLRCGINNDERGLVRLLPVLQLTVLAMVCGVLPETAVAIRGADCIWAEGMGLVSGDLLKPQEAKQLALRQARAQAIEKAVGIEVRAETLVRDFMVASDFIKTLTKGYIQSEQVLRWEQERYQKKATEAPIPIYRVTLKACVKPLATLHDPGFTVVATVNKVVFAPGEKARLDITSTRPAEIMIFNLTADDRVLPYDRMPWMGLPLQLEPSERGTFPPTGVALVMELPPGYPRTSEAFILVATKQADHVMLPLPLGTEGTVSLPEFYAALATVEADLVETIVPYSIIGR